jgi:hypothetical protein
MASSRTAHDSIWTASLANLLLTVLPADEGFRPWTAGTSAADISVFDEKD